MLLTARKVTGAEAVAMGLADRLVPTGSALPAAIELAHQMSAFPQIAMRSDRMSAIRQWNLSERDAIALETELSIEARAKEAQAGAGRFASGSGRHGQVGKD